MGSVCSEASVGDGGTFGRHRLLGQLRQRIISSDHVAKSLLCALIAESSCDTYNRCQSCLRKIASETSGRAANHVRGDLY